MNNNNNYATTKRPWFATFICLFICFLPLLATIYVYFLFKKKYTTTWEPNVDDDVKINRTKDRIYESALYLAKKYPMLCSMNMKKKSGFAEVRLRDKRFSKDKNKQKKVLDNTTSGGVTLNDVIWHIGQEELPFGGVGPSGTGSYHGHDGFKEFSHAKAVYKQFSADLMAQMMPPYKGKMFESMKNQIKKQF